MRFPDSQITGPASVGNAGAIAPVTPLPAVAAVSASAAAPVVHSESARGVVEHDAAHAQPSSGEEEGPGRLGEDRRKYCRRIHNLPVLLDTLSGLDRRGPARRDEDEVAGIDMDA